MSEAKSNDNPEAKSNDNPETKSNDNPETKSNNNPQTKSNDNLETKSNDNLETKSNDNLETKSNENPQTTSNTTSKTTFNTVTETTSNITPNDSNDPLELQVSTLLGINLRAEYAKLAPDHQHGTRRRTMEGAPMVLTQDMISRIHKNTNIPRKFLRKNLQERNDLWDDEFEKKKAQFTELEIFIVDIILTMPNKDPTEHSSGN